MKRPRGRGRKNHNSGNRTYDSNGPDVKIRGTASHLCDKYQALARDANASGDYIRAENYLQHAEHYFRIVKAAQANNQNAQGDQAQNGQNRRGNGSQPRQNDHANGNGAAEETADTAEAPADVAEAKEEAPAEVTAEDTAEEKPRRRTRKTGTTTKKRTTSRKKKSEDVEEEATA